MGPRHIVSHYEIVTLLGKGGMGEVYVGLDTTLQRKVAVKALRPDQRLDAVARARLLREARILSQLDHPNICRVYDFVEEGDRDFLILELIEGQSLRDALNGGLSPALNMSISEQIAAALAAAHAAGVVHRDLKPENVMLLPDHTVKVLDFGLARSFDSHPVLREAVAPVASAGVSPLDTLTQTTAETVGVARATLGDGTGAVTVDGALLGTPMYMSPEQVEGAPATTASDMYSFGLLVQELYTRERPFPPGSDVYAVMARILTGNVPAPVGLGRDLTALITRLKALAPSQRPTAADTLERLRVIREKPRKRIQYAAAAVLVLAAVAGGIKYAVDVTRERTAALAAREEATQRRGQAEALIGFMLGDLRGKLQRVGRLDILDDVGQRAMAYFAAVPEASISNEELFRRSQAVHQIGQVRQARGDMKGATAAYDESLKLAQTLSARDPNNGEWQIGLGASHFYAGDILRLQGDFDGAMQHYGEYRDIAQKLVDRGPDNPTYLLELSYGHSNVAAALEAKGELEEARRELELSLQLKQRLAEGDPADSGKAEAVANGHNRLGIVLERLGEPTLALEHYERDLEIGESLLLKSPDDTQRTRRVADAASYVGLLNLDAGDYADARERLRVRHRLMTRLAQKEPANIQWKRDLAMAELSLASVDNVQGDHVEGLRRARVATAMLDEVLGKADAIVRFSRDRARADIEVARAALARGLTTEALGAAADATERLDPLVKRDPNDLDARRFLAQAHLIRAEALRGAGDPAGGRQEAQRALNALGDAAPRVRERRFRAAWARALVDSGRVRDAQPIISDLVASGYRDAQLKAAMRPVP